MKGVNKMENLTEALWEIYDGYNRYCKRYDNQMPEPISEEERIYRQYREQKENTANNFAYYLRMHPEKLERLSQTVVNSESDKWSNDKELSKRIQKMIGRELAQLFSDVFLK